MPDIRHKGTIRELAFAYINNGRKQEQSMIDIGYSKAYAKSYCGKMWDNKAVLDAVDTLEAEINRKTDVTHAEIIARLRLYSGLDTAKDSDELKPITSGDQLKSLELLGKSKAMFKDKVITEDAADSPTPEEADQISEEKRLSVANKPKLVERTG